MDNANNATPATSASSVTPMEQFDTELEAVETFVSTHQVDDKVSPAAQLNLDHAKEQAYLRTNPKEGLRFLHRARVAAMRYHAGQTILQATRLQEKLGQKASKQASFVLGHAKLVFGEGNLILSIRESAQALTLFTSQVKQIEESQTKANDPAPLDQGIFQVPTLVGTSPDLKKLQAESDEVASKLRSKKRPQKKSMESKKPSKGKKHQAAAA